MTRVAFVGNPNAGKSTLFNALTGASAHVGNYPGITVSAYSASMAIEGRQPVEAIDLPGTYSLAARSPEERIAIDTVLGFSGPAPDLVVVVVDTPRLLRSLYIVLQLLELELPVVIALNMMDEARTQGCVPDVSALSEALGVPCVPCVARSREGLDALREAIGLALDDPSAVRPGPRHGLAGPLADDVKEVARDLSAELLGGYTATSDRATGLALWCLLSLDSDEALASAHELPHALVASVQARAVAAGRDLQGEIVGLRYLWIDSREAVFLGHGARVEGPAMSDKVDKILLHPFSGGLIFLATMALIFTALFSWSDPVIGLIEDAMGGLGGVAGALFDGGTGATGLLAIVRDLVVDGLIGGVGAVVVFVPQIALLSFFIAFMEDSGYLARAAYLMDRILRAAGLPGQAFVPLLSGFACAVPAILATRTMPRFRDRLLTMMVIPLTSCSARLPIYTLLIAALFPAWIDGWPLPLRPTMLMALYLFSTAVTVVAAIVLGRTIVRDTATPALIELPPYRMPQARMVLRTTWERSLDFLREAGRVILVATVVLWALLYFPQHSPDDLVSPSEVASLESRGVDVELVRDGRAKELSYGGQLGHLIEPTIRPLGYDWRIGVGLIGSFAAREVFVATMGIVYGVGDPGDETDSLRNRMLTAQHEDGTQVFTPLTGISLMVFFALAMQCLSTLAVLRRETNGWKWPGFIFAYMTALAWTAAFVIFQVGSLFGL